MGKPKKTTTRKLFQEWLAIPHGLRGQETNIATQKEFAAKYKVDPATLSRWKAEEGFMDAVDRLRKHRLDEHLTDIYQSLVDKAKSGDTNAMRFAFELAGRYHKETTVNHQSRAEEDAASMSDEELVDNFVRAIGGEASENFKSGLMNMLSSPGSDGEGEPEGESETEGSGDEEENEIFDRPGLLMDQEFEPDYETGDEDGKQSGGAAEAGDLSEHDEDRASAESPELKEEELSEPGSVEQTYEAASAE